MINLSDANIIFMKYGVHASEDVEEIIKRKMEEVEKCQMMFWGYGGRICNPLTLVQPFFKENPEKKAYLLLSLTDSKLNNEPQCAAEYSIDNEEWNPIPDGIKVKGSDFAIVCKNIERVDFDINLSDYIVPVGNCEGRPLSEYIQFQVDKACGKYSPQAGIEPKIAHITLCAEIVDPFSVFLRLEKKPEKESEKDCDK